MSRANVRMLQNELPASHLGKRARIDQLQREASHAGQETSLCVCAWLLLGLLVTGCLLVYVQQAGWW